MNFWERAKIGWESFRRTGGIELPDSGRSSEETLGGAMSSYLAAFGTVSPVIDFEMLAVLKRLWLFNPDFSQYVANIVQLGNPGHTLAVDAKSDAAAEAAVNRLNESASRLYTHGAGVDGLINQYLTSVAWSGAISSEDVVNLAGRRVEKVVLVPVEQIRFLYNKDLDEYEPYQKSGQLAVGSRQNLGLIKLNQETYKYVALGTVENSPYAKPPGTAAVEAILDGQRPIMENIQAMAQKVGLMGLISASVVPPPKKPNETDAEYHARASSYLKRVRDALKDFTKGLLVTFRDQRIEHTPVTTGATDVYDLNRISEEQVFSGLAAMPGFHGRTDSTTETFADVVYYLLTAQVQNIQRVVKRRQEATYRLDLRLGGLEVNGVSLVFNKAKSRNALGEAQTEDLKFRTVLEKIQAGAISPDEGASELGYDTWFDLERLMDYAEEVIHVKRDADPAASGLRRLMTLTFDKASQAYRYQPKRLMLAGDHSDNVVPFVKKKALQA